MRGLFSSALSVEQNRGICSAQLFEMNKLGGLFSSALSVEQT